MSEPLLVPGQPYPGLPGWQDLSGHLANGWHLGNSRDYLKVLIEGNTQTIRGRVRIGTSREMTGVLPGWVAPGGSLGASTESAIVWTTSGSSAGTESCVVELWNSNVLALTNNTIGPGVTAADREGAILLFTIICERRRQT